MTIVVGFLLWLFGSVLGFAFAKRRQYATVWKERAGRTIGMTLCALVLLALLEACSSTQRAAGASWFDRAMTTICAEYPVLLRPRILELADSAPPEPAAAMDAGVDAAPAPVEQ